MSKDKYLGMDTLPCNHNGGDAEREWERETQPELRFRVGRVHRGSLKAEL